MARRLHKKALMISGLALFANLAMVAGASAAIVPNPDARKYTLGNVVGMMPTAVKIMLGLSGSIALLAFIYGGVLFLLSSGNRETVEKGKSVIKGAVVGLILVFLSYTIINVMVRAMCTDAQGQIQSDTCKKWNSWSI